MLCRHCELEWAYVNQFCYECQQARYKANDILKHKILMGLSHAIITHPCHSNHECTFTCISKLLCDVHDHTEQSFLPRSMADTHTDRKLQDLSVKGISWFSHRQPGLVYGQTQLLKQQRTAVAVCCQLLPDMKMRQGERQADMQQ